MPLSDEEVRRIVERARKRGAAARAGRPQSGVGTGPKTSAAGAALSKFNMGATAGYSPQIQGGMVAAGKLLTGDTSIKHNYRTARDQYKAYDKAAGQQHPWTSGAAEGVGLVLPASGVTRAVRGAKALEKGIPTAKKLIGDLFAPRSIGSLTKEGTVLGTVSGAGHSGGDPIDTAISGAGGGALGFGTGVVANKLAPAIGRIARKRAARKEAKEAKEVIKAEAWLEKEINKVGSVQEATSYIRSTPGATAADYLVTKGSSAPQRARTGSTEQAAAELRKRMILRDEGAPDRMMERLRGALGDTTQEAVEGGIQGEKDAASKLYESALGTYEEGRTFVPANRAAVEELDAIVFDTKPRNPSLRKVHDNLSNSLSLHKHKGDPEQGARALHSKIRSLGVVADGLEKIGSTEDAFALRAYRGRIRDLLSGETGAYGAGRAAFRYAKQAEQAYDLGRKAFSGSNAAGFASKWKDLLTGGAVNGTLRNLTRTGMRNVLEDSLENTPNKQLLDKFDTKSFRDKIRTIGGIEKLAPTTQGAQLFAGKKATTKADIDALFRQLDAEGTFRQTSNLLTRPLPPTQQQTLGAAAMQASVAPLSMLLPRNKHWAAAAGARSLGHLASRRARNKGVQSASERNLARLGSRRAPNLAGLQQLSPQVTPSTIRPFVSLAGSE